MESAESSSPASINPSHGPQACFLCPKRREKRNQKNKNKDGATYLSFDVHAAQSAMVPGGKVKVSRTWVIQVNHFSQSSLCWGAKLANKRHYPRLFSETPYRQTTI